MKGEGMTGTVWLEISCELPEAFAEEFADFLLESTGNGVSIENRKVDTFNIDDIGTETVKNVKAYIESDKNLDQLLDEIARYMAEKALQFPGFTAKAPVVTELKEEDWANSWKVNFKPTRIGNSLVIKPSWEELTPQPGDVVLEIDPGMAFGTGTHSTTKLCLEALERYIDRAACISELQLLDLGCGSGVLGIAAALFGAGRVVAVDIDPIAVEVTRENAAVNRVEQLMEISGTPLESIVGSFDIILANILAEALVEMRRDLTGHLKAGGTLILSGILAEREQFVLEGFSTIELELLEITSHEEWRCIVFRKTGR